jgi:lipopolysaccharide transport system ATP-binding protein
LKVLSRITPPSKGRILVGGRVASLLEVGTGFHPELTGRENVYLNGALMGMSKVEIKRKFDEIVEFADVIQFLDTPVKRYSSGMYVRLAFAVAAHLEPDILFIDEVLAVGDARFQKKCLGKMEQVAQEGRTILFVSHNMSTLGFCNKGLLLEKGKMVGSTDLQECIQRYNETVSSGSGHAWSGDVGNHQLRIKSFRLYGENSPLSFFKRGDKARLAVEFEALKDTRDAVISFYCYNKYGSQLFAHKIAIDDHILFNVEKGNYRLETEIDFSYFAEGCYRLELDAAIHNIQRLTPTDLQLQFEVINHQKKSGEPVNTLFPGWASSLKKVTSINHIGV